MKKRIMTILLAAALGVSTLGLPASSHTGNFHGGNCEGSYAFDHGMYVDSAGTGGWAHTLQRTYIHPTLVEVRRVHYQNGGWVGWVKKNTTIYSCYL